MKRLKILSVLFAISVLFAACTTPYGVYHTVKKGETLKEIAEKYHTTTEAVVRANALTSETVSEGESLFIPGVESGEQSVAPDKTEPSTVFSEPERAPSLPSDTSSSNASELVRPVEGKPVRSFGEDGSEGVDFSCAPGEQVKAALPGTVLFAASHRSFGNTVIIRHAHSRITVYAFLSEFLTKEGAIVEAGQPIGICGVAQGDTRPVLHFEVRVGGKPVKPPF